MRSPWDDALASLERALSSERFDDARTHAQRALETGQARFGASDVRLGTALYALGVACARLGDLRAADQALVRALELSMGPRGEPGLAVVCTLRAAVLEATGDDAALVAFLREERVRDVVARSRTLLTTRGLAEARLGDAAAGRSLEAALVLTERALPTAGAHEVAQASFNAATHPAPGVTRSQREARLRRAASLLAGGAPPGAQPRAAGGAPPGAQPRDAREPTELAARVHHNLGVLLAEGGRGDEALVELGRALTLFTELYGPTDARARPTLVRLADLHERAGRGVLSLSLLARALDLARSSLPEEHAAVRALTRDLAGGTA